MRTTTRRALSFVLTLAMLFSMAMPTAFAAEPVVTAEKAYSDIAGHWAEKPIERWDDYGIVSGFGEEFRPNGTITRGQMASILSNLLNLTEEAENTFSDVPEGKWYTTFVLRCVKAGIMAGANGKAMPEKEITRQEAMTMLCQALGIEPKADADLSKYTDADQMARWAKPFVGALVEAGIVSGVSADKLGSLSSMSRGAVMTVLDKAVAQYINTPGTYELTDKEGIVLVASDDVKLTGETKATILVSSAVDKNTVTREEEEVVMGGGGARPSRPATPPAPVVEDLIVSAGGDSVTSGAFDDITIAASVADDDVTLENLTIEGDLIVEGGGSNTITIRNCIIGGMILMRKQGGEPPRILLEDTPVASVVVEQPAIIEAADQKSPVTNVEVKANVTIQGADTKVATVEVTAAAAPVQIEVAGGKVETVEAKSEAVVSGVAATVGKVVAEAPVTVDAEAVDTVEIPETVTTSVAIAVTGTGNVAVEVNTESGANITTSAESNVQLSTELTTAPAVSVDGTEVTHFHEWIAGTSEEATCTKAGIKTFTCNDDNCSEQKIENIAKLNHTEVVDPAVDPTCTEAGKTAGAHCSVCNTVIKEQESDPAKGHDMTEQHYDATGHWNECARCEEKGNVDAHTLDTKNCAIDAHCTGCDYVKPAGEHAWNQGEVTKDSTCTVAGIKTFSCTADGCGTTSIEAIDLKPHTEVADAAVDATCTSTGLTAGKHCSVCGTVTVPQMTVEVRPHAMTETDYDDVNHWAVCEACGEKGEAVAHKYVVNNCAEAEKCSGCDYVKQAGEHAWNQGEVTKEATCTVAGIKTFSCTADGCGATSESAIAAPGHIVVTDAAVEATCTKAGLTVGSHCSVCEEVFVAQEEVDMVDHKWDEGKVTTEPTTTTEGVKTYTCGTCGGTKTESVPVLPSEEKEGEYAVSDIYIEYGTLNWTIAEDTPETAEYLIEVSEDGTVWKEAGWSSSNDHYLVVTEVGSYYIRINTVVNNEIVGNTIDQTVKLNVIEGKKLTDVKATFEYKGLSEEVNHSYDVTISGLTPEREYHLEAYTSDYEFGWGSNADENGVATFSISGPDYKNLFDNGNYCVYEFYNFITSDNMKVYGYTYDYTDEMKCAEESEEPEQGKISIVVNGNDYRASWTGFDNVSRFAYALVDQNNKMVSMQWLNEGVTVSNDFRMFLPLTESGTATYDFVLYEVIDNKTGEVLGRIEDAFEVTASGSPLSYDMEFAHEDYVEGSYTAKYNTITWKEDSPTGIWAIGAWFRNNNQYTRNVGTISSPSMDYIHQIQEGDVFDLRVVTAYELDGQTLKATITPESKKTYTVASSELGTTTNVSIYATSSILRMDWEAKPDYTGNYYVNGKNVYTSTFYHLLNDVVAATEPNVYSYTISTTNDNGATLTEWAKVENILTIQFDESKTPDVEILGQADGTYKLVPKNGFTGLYKYELYAPDGTFLYKWRAAANGTIKVAPYEGCYFMVQEVNYPLGKGLENVTATISSSERFSFTPYDFTDTKVTITENDETALANALNAGGTVTLESDVTINNIRVEQGGDVVLDLNGHNITMGSNTLEISRGKVISIIDSSEKAGVINGAISPTGKSSVALDGITLLAETMVEFNPNGARNITVSNCTIGSIGLHNVEKADISNTVLDDSVDVYNTLATFTNCIYDETNTAHWFNINENASVVLNDMRFKASANTLHVRKGDLTINSGTYTYTGVDTNQDLIYVDVDNGGTCTIKGGTYNYDPSADTGVTIGDGCIVNNNGDGTWTVTIK